MVAIVDSNGTILSKANLIAKASVVAQPTKYLFGENIYEMTSARGATFAETVKYKKYYAGQIVGADAIDALPEYQTATFVSATPNSALPAVGGTTITIIGTNLNGVTGVTFGGTIGTSLKKYSDTKITVVTPAKAAGTHAISVIGGFGTLSAGNGVFA